MKVWILLSRFDLGGLERVQTNLAPVFAQAGLDVRIVAGQFLEGTENLLPQGIVKLELAPQGKHVFIPALLKQLLSHKPDVIITTSNDVACLVLAFRSLFFPRMKVICTQHLSVSAPLKNTRGLQRAKHRLLLGLMQYLWPKSDAIIAVSSLLADDMQSTLKLRPPIHIIHNPVVLPDSQDRMQHPIQWPWPDNSVQTLVFAGRLAKVKRLDILLDAFLQITQTHKVRLLILGDGPERDYVRSFIVKHGLSPICHLAGYQDNPLPWIKASNVLILPSDYEGFGNVLVEAMACGTQVISTNCPHGPAEILDHGRYGQLVPTNNVNALANAVLRVLSKEFYIPATTLMRRANEFSQERAANAYLRVIHDTASKA